MAGTIAIAAPLVQSEAGAHVIRAGIQYEALLRDHHDRWASLISTATGRDTERQRWARGERTARARLAPNRPTSASGCSARVLAWARPGGHHRSSGRRARERLDRVGAPVAGRPRRTARALVRRRAGGQPGLGILPHRAGSVHDDPTRRRRARGAAGDRRSISDDRRALDGRDDRPGTGDQPSRRGGTPRALRHPPAHSRRVCAGEVGSRGHDRDAPPRRGRWCVLRTHVGGRRRGRLSPARPRRHARAGPPPA